VHDVLRGSIEQWTLEACHSAGFLDIETSDGMADFMEVVNLRDEARNLKGLSDCDKLFQYAQELWEESKSDGERYAAITGLEAAMFHGDAPQSEAASIIEEAYREGKGVDGSPLEAIAWHAVAERDMYTLRKYITVLYEERRIRELVQWLDLTSSLGSTRAMAALPGVANLYAEMMFEMGDEKEAVFVAERGMRCIEKLFAIEKEETALKGTSSALGESTREQFEKLREELRLIQGNSYRDLYLHERSKDAATANLFCFEAYRCYEAVNGFKSEMLTAYLDIATKEDEKIDRAIKFLEKRLRGQTKRYFEELQACNSSNCLRWGSYLAAYYAFSFVESEPAYAYELFSVAADNGIEFAQEQLGNFKKNFFGKVVYSG
jgi:TPR repeat protein